MRWEDVSVKQFKELQKVDTSDIEGQIRAAEILLGDVDDLKWVDFCKKLNTLDFLNQEMPKIIIRKSYTLNGRKYCCNANLQELSVNRYMDFCNLSKSGEWDKVLAVVLIPEGKNYGEYDVEQVYSDIESMSIVDAQAVFSFFQMQWQTCIKAMKDYLVKEVKMDKGIREAISDIMESYCTSDR